MANKVTIDVEARFVDNITDESKAASKAVEGIGKEADKAQKQVDKLSKQKASPTFDADNNKFLNKIRSMEAKMSKLGHSKTAAVLHAVDKASTVIGKVMNKAKQFGGKTWQSMLKFKDSEALASIKKVTSGVENLTKKTWTTLVKVKDMALSPIKAIKNALFSIPTLITTIIGAKVVQEAVIKPTSLADQYTKAQIGFSTLLGETRGQAMMDEIDSFAAATPFKTSNVISNVQKMMAYGWDAERVIEDMKTIGDAAASTGRGDEGLASIVYALSEIRTKGKLSTQELNQLASAGIKAKMYLAEGLGYGTSDAGLKKLAADLEDGAIGANQAIELILEGMKEFNGMMDQTANETVGGLKDQLSDLFEINVGRKWGQGLQDGLKKALGSVVKLIDGADDALGAIGDTLYELGSDVSNWVATKFENAVQRVENITGTFEFQNASGKEKISMLWNGVVADPVKEWWNGGGREKVVDTAKEVGTSIGKAILEGISMAWDAMPWWGKLLVGGYAAGKTLSGVGNVIGGISNIIGGVSKTSALLSNGAANVGYWALGGKTAATMAGVSGGTAALAGAGTVAAGAGMAWGTYKTLESGINAINHLREGDKRSAGADAVRAVSTGGGMLVGAKLGATFGTALGGPLGTLIGGAAGALGGWLLGDTIAKNMEAAKYESKEMQEMLKSGEASAEELNAQFEKDVWLKTKELFGDMALSTAEIATLSQQIVLGDKVEAMEEFAAAAKGAESSLSTLKSSVASLDKWNWKVGLGVTLSAKEQKNYVESIQSFIDNAAQYIENRQYEFTTSVKLLMNTDEGSVGESIIKDNDDFYKDVKEKIAGYSSQLEELMSTALDNGTLKDVIDITIDGEKLHIDEASAIEKLQEQITNIVNSINKAKEQAQLDMIEIKFMKSDLSADSYKELQASIDAYMETALGNIDEAKLNVLTTLNWRLDTAKTEEEKTKIQNQINAALDEYGIDVDNFKANVNGFVLNLAADKFSADELLGADAMDDINNLINTAFKEGIKPAELTGDDVIRILGLKDMKEETATVLANILGNLQYDSELTLNTDPKVADGTTEKVKSVIESSIPNTVNKTLSANLTIDVKTNYTGDKLPTAPYNSRPGYNLARYRGGIVGGSSAMEGFALGGRPDDGMLKGSTRFIRVNEESPEMIIPLSSQRRGRALKLWAQAGNIMGVPGFARGGMTSGGNDEGIRFQNYGSNESAGGQSVQVDIGGITFEINVNGNDTQNITEAIKAQAEEIAEVVAGVLADSLGSQFENTPARGGAA